MTEKDGFFSESLEDPEANSDSESETLTDNDNTANEASYAEQDSFLYEDKLDETNFVSQTDEDTMSVPEESISDKNDADSEVTENREADVSPDNTEVITIEDENSIPSFEPGKEIQLPGEEASAQMIDEINPLSPYAAAENTRTAQYTCTAGESLQLTGEGSNYSYHTWVSSDNTAAEVEADHHTAVILSKQAGSVTITHKWGNKANKQNNSETFVVVITEAEISELTKTETDLTVKINKVAGTHKLLADKDLVVEKLSAGNLYDEYAALCGDDTLYGIYDIYLKDQETGERSELPSGSKIKVTINADYLENGKSVRIGHYKNPETPLEVLNESGLSIDKVTVSAKSISFFITSFSTFTVSAPSTAPSGTGDYSAVYEESSLMGNDTVQNLIGSANQWQIISGKYENNNVSNKTIASNGRVRVQKNVIPTDTENEFLMYLSVDINRESIVQEIFEGVGIVHTPSNNVPAYGGVWTGEDAKKADNCWATGKKDGNMRPFTIEKVGNTRYEWTLNITADGKTYTITRYAEDGSFNNGHILMKIGGNWMTVGDAAKNQGNATVMNISIDDNAFKTLLSQVTDVDIGTVVDNMGPGITATEIVSYKPSGGTNSAVISSDGRTINWNMVASTMGYTNDGWYPNIAEMVYKITYTPSVSNGLNTDSKTVSSNPSAEVVTNSNAQLNYKVTTTTGSTTAVQDFPSPVIRGMLYEIKGVKKASGSNTPLSGAIFTLYSDAACTQAIGNTSTDQNGLFNFQNLQYGTYYLRETMAPSGYRQIDDTVIRLCYTDNANELTGQGPSEEALYYPENEEFILIDPRNQITVTKTVTVSGNGIETSDINQTIYFALKNKTTGEYVKDTSGSLLTKTVTITNGVPTPSSVTFGEGNEYLPTDIYEIEELLTTDSSSPAKLEVGYRFSSNGKNIQVYSISGYETNINSQGQTVTTTGNDADLRYSNTSSVAFTNTYSKESTMIFVANKKWTDKDNQETSAPAQSTVTFTLFQNGTEFRKADGSVYSITLDGNADTGEGNELTSDELVPWQATFSDLPIYQSDGVTEYTYTVKETACSNAEYSSVTEELTQNGGSITNKQKTASIVIRKEDTENNALSGAVFTLVKVETDSTGSHDTLIKSEFTVTENGYAIEGLVSGEYKLTEISAPAGYIITVPSAEFRIDTSGSGDVIVWKTAEKPDNAKELSGDNNNIITIINTPGQQLPSTGGTGVRIYTESGLLVIIGSLILGIRLYLAKN